MTPKLPRCDQLPVVLPALTDELLSSWICRHAVFYGIPPVTMLRHCLADASAMRAIDLRLTAEQGARIAHVLRTDATVVRQMSFANVSARVASMDRCTVNAVLCELLAPSKFEWARACATKSTSRMAFHLRTVRFAAYR